MDDLTPMERAVIDKLLVGDDEPLVGLRAQAVAAKVLVRDFTGVGFFSRLWVPDSMRLPEGGRFTISDIHAEMDGLTHGAGFVLFVSDGLLETLEGFTYDESWPPETGSFQLEYIEEPRTLDLPS